MRAKTELKKQAIKLRVERQMGLEDISKELSIAKSTASTWLRDYPLDPEEVRERYRTSVPKVDPSFCFQPAFQTEGLNIKQKGVLAVSKVETRAALKGATVSRPTTDCCPYDLVIDWEGKLYRVQVKWANAAHTSSTGSVNLNFRKISRTGRSIRTSYSAEEIDALVVYLPAIDQVLWFGQSHFDGKRHLTMRYLPTLNNQSSGVKMAQDYIW